MGAGHLLDADCLGQGIPVGSWLADLFSRCTYNHVPPNFLNTSPIVLLLASGSLLYRTPPFHPATPPLSPCFLGSIFLFWSPPRRPYHSSTRPVALSVRPTTSHTRLASHLTPRASGSRTSLTGLGSRAIITERRLLAADTPEHRPASHCAFRQFLKFGFLTAKCGTATRGERR